MEEKDTRTIPSKTLKQVPVPSISPLRERTEDKHHLNFYDFGCEKAIVTKTNDA